MPCYQTIIFIDEQRQSGVLRRLQTGKLQSHPDPTHHPHTVQPKSGAGLAGGQKVIDSADAIVLLQKKAREQKKRQRLKALEEQFEQRRDKKQKYIDHRITESTHNKVKKIEDYQKRLSRESKLHKEVSYRAQDSRVREVDDCYDRRKALINDSPSSSRSSRVSRASNSSLKFPIRKEPLDRTTIDNPEDIEKQLIDIRSKIQNANQSNQKQQERRLSRVSLHNSSLGRAQEKADYLVATQKARFSSKIATKLTQAMMNKSMHDRSVTKRQEEKEKLFKDKVNRCKDNLSYQVRSQAGKDEELNERYNKIKAYQHHVEWHDERADRYLAKFVQNSQVLQRRKVRRGDEIVGRHQEISYKNRVYRQRKDSLVKAIKYNPSQAIM